jgi:polyhydroxybutyrate depolymerase
MRTFRRFSVLRATIFGSLLFLSPAPGRGAENLPAGFQRMEFSVEGVKREALVYAPATARTASTPVVFVFHGHGGSARQVEQSFGIDRLWPDAISVYMQGLNTPGQLTDPSGNEAGWQAAAGNQGDRDLKFFDAVLARLKQDYRVDEKRIYATGHSNGGGFTYLLWAERGNVFAAVAPSAAVARYVERLAPKPAMLLAGSQDTLVKFAWQQRMMEAVRRRNGCDPTGQPWGTDATIYSSRTGTPVVTFIHPGGHQFDQDAAPLIVKFFKEHPAPAK